MWWASALIFVIDLVVIVRAISRGHGVENTMAWVFAILALPIVGALGYLTLASPSISRTTSRKRARNLPLRSAASARDWNSAGGSAATRGHFESVCPVHTSEAAALRVASAVTGLDAWRGNDVRLLAEADDAVGRMADAVAGAKRTIWAEFYIIKNDATGAAFLDTLAARARDGVEVHLLYDALGSLGIDAKRLAAIREAGGQVHAFLPFNPLRRRWAINLRNHRKLVVVDGEVGFTGGMNVGDEYSGRFGSRITRQVKGQIGQLQRTFAGTGTEKASAEKPAATPGGKEGGGAGGAGSGLIGSSRSFRDMHLRMRGPVVADLAQIFAEDWSFATDQELPLPAPPPPVDEGEVAIVVPSGPDQEHNASGMLYFSGISTARERIWLTSAYFVPDHATITALIGAALRGVDVRVLVPAKSDVAIVDAAARSNFRELLRGGVRVFQYLPSVLHAKTMVVDGTWGMVGSANVDIRSFRLNFELGALVVGQRFAGRMETVFKADLEKSRELQAAEFDNLGFKERLGIGLARLVSPLL